MSDSKDSKPTDPVSDEEIPDEKAARMSFTGHLGELRTRMVHTTIVLGVLFFIGLGFSQEIMTALKQPVEMEGIEWVTLAPLESFMVNIKIALL